MKNKSTRETVKSQAIEKLKKFSSEEIDELVRTRLNYVMCKVRVLETHFVSGLSGVGERTQATPRNDEFKGQENTPLYLLILRG